jgi:AcrR family transcriptional regulator
VTRPAARGRTGRRPGAPGTRDRILAAARACFAEAGYDGATVRGVAARAEVDPALVHHYFGSKQQLFVAAMELPVDVPAVVPQVLAGPPEELGRRFVDYVLRLWDTPAYRPLLLGVVRSATTDAVAAGMLRQLLAEGPLLALARTLDRPDASLRAVLAGSQVIGLAMARYVVKVEPVASASLDELVRAIAPAIQHYLAGDLGGPGDDAPPPATLPGGAGDDAPAPATVSGAAGDDSPASATLPGGAGDDAPAPATVSGAAGDDTPASATLSGRAAELRTPGAGRPPRRA